MDKDVKAKGLRFMGAFLSLLMLSLHMKGEINILG